jgi:hypothetical protein
MWGRGGSALQLSLRTTGLGWQFSAALFANYGAGVAVISSYHFLVVSGGGIALGEAATHFPKLQPTSTYPLKTSAPIIVGMAIIDVIWSPT